MGYRPFPFLKQHDKHHSRLLLIVKDIMFKQNTACLKLIIFYLWFGSPYLMVNIYSELFRTHTMPNCTMVPHVRSTEGCRDLPNYSGVNARQVNIIRRKPTIIILQHLTVICLREITQMIIKQANMEYKSII